MAVYILTLAILIFPFISKGSRVFDVSRSRTILYFLILFLVSGLSYNLGADTRGLSSGEGYVDAFKNMPGLSNLSSQYISYSSTWQPGFAYLLSFFKSFTSNYLIYQLFHAFLINIVVVYFIKKNTSHVGLCLFFYCLLYYLDLNFEIQRESYAIVLGLIIYLYLEEHQGFFAKIIAVSIAVLGFFLIHKSAFILILYPLLKDVRLGKKGLFVCFIVTVLIQVLWMNFSDLGGVLELIAGDTYQGYIRTEVLDSMAGIGWAFYIWLTFWKVVIPFAILFCAYKSSNPKYLIFVVFSIIFENLTYFSFAFHRMYGYFTPFYWLAITEAVIYLGNKMKLMRKTSFRLAFIMCMIAYIMYTYHIDYFTQDPYPTSNAEYIYNWYVPYQSVLQSGNSYLN